MKNQNDKNAENLFHIPDFPRQPPWPSVLFPLVRHHLGITERLCQENQEPAEMHQRGRDHEQDIRQVREIKIVSQRVFLVCLHI